MKMKNPYGLWGLKPEEIRIQTPIEVPLKNKVMPDSSFDKLISIGAIVAVELRENELQLLDTGDMDVDILYCFVEGGGDLPNLYHTLHYEINSYESAKTFVMSGSRVHLPDELQEEKKYILTEENTLGGEPTCYMGKLEDIIPVQERIYNSRAVGSVRFIYTFDLRNRWVIRDFFHTRKGEPYIMSNEKLDIIMQYKDVRRDIW